MKKILRFFALTFAVGCLLVGSASAEDKKSDLADQAIQETSNILSERYQLYNIAVTGVSEKDHFKTIGVKFQIYRPLTKEEGRQILVASTEELLKQLNTPELLPFLTPSPFTEKNVQVVIFVYDEKGQDVYHPQIGVFAMENGKVEYHTEIPQKKFGYYSSEEESYEQAKKASEEASSQKKVTEKVPAQQKAAEGAPTLAPAPLSTPAPAQR